MPSFDVVSEADMSEVDNAIHNVMREISVRYDFKGSKSSVESSDDLGLEQPVQFKNFRD